MASTSTDLFDAYFRRADLDGDGKISGAEAVAFFQGSGLPKQVLAQVWTYANQKNAAYLDRQDFYNALKLVTVAQRKRDLTPDIVKAALFSPASAKIPAPQINLSAIPAPSGGGGGVRPPQPQEAGNAGMNPQYVASQQNQYMRQQQQQKQQPQVGPPVTASHPQQLVGSHTTPMTAPRASNPSGWSVGSKSRQISQVPSQPITPPGLDGFGMTGSPSVQPRLQVNSGQMVSTPSKPQDMATSSNLTISKDSKAVGVSGNGFPSDSLFGDVFSPAPAQPKPSFPPTTSSANTVTVSSALVPSSVGPQSSVKPNSVASSQSTLPQQPFGGHSTGRQNLQHAMPSSSSGVPVGAVNLASSPSQPSWPKMTPSNIQNYLKVFVQVDHDRDGKISGEQARNLFLSWRLPREALKKIWDLSDQDNDSMLSLREFCIALYLMERFREGHPLPLTLPNSITSDEVLLSATNNPAALNGSGAWGSAPGMRQPQVMTGTRPTAAAARPPRPPMLHPVPQTEEKHPTQHKPKVPVLEKHLLYQLSQEEQDSLNSKFQEASQADKKVEELEKEISDSRQKIEFYHSKMQELILYKSRVDNRLNEVSERVSADKREVETLSKKYEEKYRQSGDVASKLTIKEATFRDIQEKKMDLYRAIIKMEEGGTAEGVIKERSEQIQSSLEELVKSVNERCKQYGLRAKPTSLLELPFGWQPGIQEGTADWDEDWDKFEDEGFTTVKELTLDIQNVVAPPKQKSSSVRKEVSSTNGELHASSSDVEVTSEQVSSPNKPHEKESAQDRKENGVVKSPPESPAGRSAFESQSHIFRDSPVRKNESADGSPHAKEIQSYVGDKNVDEPGWGKFDYQYDTDSVWGTDSLSGKDFDHGLGEFGLNPIRTGPSHGDKISKGKSSSIFADSVPGTPAYNQVKSSFPFADSVPSTPAYSQGKSSFAFTDSVPSTPVYNQGKNSYAFVDSVPSTPAYNPGRSSFPSADSFSGTPAYNFGNSPRRFSDGTEDHSFDSFSRLDSFNMTNIGLFQSSGPSLSRFDSIGSTRDADQSYGFSSRFDSFRESGDYDQSQGFSRFDSFRETDQGHGFSRFDSFRETDDYSNGFPSNLDSSGETRDSDNNHAFSRFDSFRSHDGGFGQPPANSGSDPVRGFRDSDSRNGFPSFDDTDPFGSNGPFRTSVESETLRKSTDDWRAF